VAVALALPLLLAAPSQSRAAFQVGLAGSSSSANSVIKSTVERGNIYWAQVAPKSVPAGFQPSNPGDPNYDWSATDAEVRTAADNHQTLILSFLDAPTWAQGPGPIRPYTSPGAWDPDTAKFAQFVRAAAVRYGGGYPDPLRRGSNLPRVTYWEAWNEPNIPGYFNARNTLGAYRALLNQAYGVLKSVHRDNVVALGGLAPVSSVPGSTPALNFAAALLCVHPVGSGYKRNSSCPHPTSFDALDVHPYSLAATPTKHAYKPGDVLVGDISKVAALVRAAGRNQIWATEFSWFTNPPNPYLGDSPAKAARYVAYSMYEMWKAGVSVVCWEQIRDIPADPRDTAALPGGGLYTSSGKPKLTLQAFSFPFVAGVTKGTGFGWGRVPATPRATVVIQQSVRGRWLTVARARTASDGTFYTTFRTARDGTYRAVAPGGRTSLGYDSRPIPPIRLHAT
jgi:hypothetical protein